MADTSAAPHAATAPYIDIKIPARNRPYYNMSKIFCIGECALAFDLDGSAANIGLFGRIAQAAAILGRQGAPVSILSEAAADPVGQAAVDTLTEAGVNTAGIDRFTDGTTPVIIRMGTRPIRYETMVTNVSTSSGPISPEATSSSSANSMPWTGACVHAWCRCWTAPPSEVP